MTMRMRTIVRCGRWHNLSFFLFDSRDKSSKLGRSKSMGASKRGQSRLQLIEQPEAMGMCIQHACHEWNIDENLGIDASDYDRIQITLKNQLPGME